MIACAAKEGSVALDGKGVHSSFAKALLDNLATPAIDIRVLLGRVRDEVYRDTDRTQEPFVYGLLSGEVVTLAKAH